MANEKRLIPLQKRIIYAGDVFNSLMAEKGWSATEAADFVKDFRTVDAVEVVHGEWVVCGDGEYVPFMCSACGKTTSWYHAQTANYCPNCGAKMDGDGNA